MAVQFVAGRVVVDRDLRQQFKRLDDKVKAKALKASTEKGKPAFIATMQANAPVETGALKLSLGDKSKQYRTKGVSLAVVGARVGFAVDVEVTLRDKRGRVVGRRRMRRDPARYIHLADELHDFIRGAFETGKGGALAQGVAALKQETERALREVARGS